MLDSIIDKDILEEPIKEAKANYEKFLNEKKDKLKKEEYVRY